MSTQSSGDAKQCRICLSGPEDERTCGRLIKPCMCKGSMQYVHVKCLNQWRMISRSKSAFYSCDTCHYSYAFARTLVVGLATSPVVLGITSMVLFTAIVFLASFVIGFFIPTLATPSYSLETQSIQEILMTPVIVANRFISISARVYDTLTYSWWWSYGDDREPQGNDIPLDTRAPGEVGLLAVLIHRFLLGLSAVGSLSFITWLWQMSIPGSLRIFRANNRNNRRDRVGNVVTILVLVFIVAGVVRTIRNLYKLNRSIAQRMLVRVEDVILEVP